jgi:hypothetical protein
MKPIDENSHNSDYLGKLLKVYEDQIQMLEDKMNRKDDIIFDLLQIINSCNGNKASDSNNLCRENHMIQDKIARLFYLHKICIMAVMATTATIPRRLFLLIARMCGKSQRMLYKAYILLRLYL